MDIYLVEDQPVLNMTYVAIIEKLGYSIKSFSCPNDFLEFMGSDGYKPARLAIITDLLMPEKTGYELMCEVRKAYPDQKFIIVSSTPEQNTGSDLACMYFTKPMRVEDFEFGLKAILRCLHCPHNVGYAKCNLIDNRDNFNISDWHCPHREQLPANAK